MKKTFLALFIFTAIPLFAAPVWQGIDAKTIVYEERPVVLTETEYNKISATKEGKAMLEEMEYKKVAASVDDINEYSGYKNRREQREMEKILEKYRAETDPVKQKALAQDVNNFKFTSYDQKAKEVGRFIYKTPFEIKKCNITSFKQAGELNPRDYEVAFDCTVGKSKSKSVKYDGDKVKILNKFYFNLRILDSKDDVVLGDYEALNGQVFNDKTILYISPRH